MGRITRPVISMASKGHIPADAAHSITDANPGEVVVDQVIVDSVAYCAPLLLCQTHLVPLGVWWHHLLPLLRQLTSFPLKNTGASSIGSIPPADFVNHLRDLMIGANASNSDGDGGLCSDRLRSFQSTQNSTYRKMSRAEGSAASLVENLMTPEHTPSSATI
jgi:hypothetical protein